MLKQVLKRTNPLLRSLLNNKSQFKAFSTEATAVDPSMYQRKHSTELMNPKFYEMDFFPTHLDDVQFMRSPYYEFAKINTMNE